VRIDELLTYQRKETDNSWTGFYATQGRHDSVVALRQADAGGTLVERVEYDPYGKASVFVGASTTPQAASSVGNPYLYAGRRMDEETGYLYLRNRYLHTGWGRFLTNDPIGNWGDGSNLGNGLAHAGNSPIVLSDPSGLYSLRDQKPEPMDADGDGILEPPGSEEVDPNLTYSEGGGGSKASCQDKKPPADTESQAKSDREAQEATLSALQNAAGNALGMAGSMAAEGDYGEAQGLLGGLSSASLALAYQASASGNEDILDSAGNLVTTLTSASIQIGQMATGDFKETQDTIRDIGSGMTNGALLAMGAVGAAQAAAWVGRGLRALFGNGCKQGCTKAGRVITTRKTPGRDGATSEFMVEQDAAGQTISTTHRVTKGGKVIHQHQEHVGQYGGVRRFPDEWTGTQTINAPPHHPTPPRLPPGSN
jgi:RHS repeat-associated protein